MRTAIRSRTPALHPFRRVTTAVVRASLKSFAVVCLLVSNGAVKNFIFFYTGESAMSQLILSFSAISNSRKILHVGPTPEESLTCVHGLRFLSLAWVIMVHTYLQVFTIAGKFFTKCTRITPSLILVHRRTRLTEY